jgi:hypothetical protein
MLKKIIALLVFSSFSGTVTLKAEPTPAPAPNSKRQSSQKIKKPLPQIVPSQPLPEGWSLVDGVWMHSDGYKFVQGQVVRTGTQTHKRPPKPPTKAQMDAVTKKKKAPLTPAEIAAAKAAEKERNMRPLPSRQTGTNL